MPFESNGKITDYVTDGIILWLDGIYNTVNGHDSSSGTWYDLSENGNTAPYRSVNIIGDNYFSPNGQGLMLDAEMPSDYLTSVRAGSTIEIVCDIDPNIETCMILPNGNYIGTVYLYQGDMCFSANNTVSNRKSVTYLSGIHYYNSSLWIDGIQQQNTSARVSYSSATKRLFSYTGFSSYVFSGKVYALRVYNRILTDAELTKNWLTDKKRFGIS